MVATSACSCSASRRSSPASTSSSRSTSSARRAWAGSSCRSSSGRIYAHRASCRCSRRRCSASRCCCSPSSAFGHIGIFDPTLGGDPVLFQHFFWFYSHPAVYIMILPGMGVISELISTYARKPIFGYRFVAYSSLSLALLSFLVWGHHMFVSRPEPAREHGVLGADVHASPSRRRSRSSTGSRRSTRATSG